MGPDGLEPSTPRLSSVCSNQLSYEPSKNGGAERVRTDDLLNANQPLFQLSYGPHSPRDSETIPQSRLRGAVFQMNFINPSKITKYDRTYLHPHSHIYTIFTYISELLLRKEVIQPQVPLRLPCYDLVPITSLALGRCLSCELAHELRAKPAFMT